MPRKKIYDQIVNTQEDEDGYFTYPRMIFIDMPVQKQKKEHLTIALTQPIPGIEIEEGGVLVERNK